MVLKKSRQRRLSSLRASIRWLLLVWIAISMSLSFHGLHTIEDPITKSVLSSRFLRSAKSLANRNLDIFPWELPPPKDLETSSNMTKKKKASRLKLLSKQRKTCKCVKCPQDPLCGQLWQGNQADASITNSTVFHEIPIHVVVSYCKGDLDYISAITEGYNIASIHVISKCGYEVRGVDSNATIEILPNVGRCDHSYAHYITTVLDQKLQETGSPGEDALVLFLKDNAGARNLHQAGWWNSMSKMVQVAASSSGFACGMIPAFMKQYQDAPRFEFSAHYEVSSLRQFRIKDYGSISDYDGDNVTFQSEFEDWGAFYNHLGADSLMEEEREIVQVCYGGVFAASVKQIKKQKKQVWKSLEQSLSRGDNIQEGHYAERMWGMLIAQPLEQYQVNAIKKYSDFVVRPGMFELDSGMASVVGAVLRSVDPDRSVSAGDEATQLITWIQSLKYGKFNDKQRLDDHNNLFADRSIAKNELLLQVPWNAIFMEEQALGLEDTYFNCALVERLAHELENGKDSHDFGPYMAYLLSPQQKNLIPSDFSDFGKELLMDLLGGEDEDLPPPASMGWVEEWVTDCQGDVTDDTARLSAMLFLQKQYNDMIIPIYADFYQHRNGHYTNTRVDHDTKYGIQVFASRNIAVGEQLHTSYNECEECGDIFENYGTAEIFRDRGVVEAMPQKWILETEEIAFELKEDSETGQIQVEWLTQLPTMDGYYFQLVQLLKRKVHCLEKIKSLSWNLHLDKVEKKNWEEWNFIWEYQNAVVKALSYAHDALEENEDLHISSNAAGESRSDEEEEEEVCTMADDGASCSFPISNHYDDLEEQYDDLDYVSPTCDNSEWMEFNGYDTLWQKQTSYQHALFNRNNVTGDTCMDIDEIVQICSCYRPHYHEFSANFPARFLDTVERVLFVGGGDSMLLHEALKYPSLQKVVGLELDQVITRKSFQYFQTQPHFDDERVEWWFGDATKSLLLLPKDYWGSFDLVLVDLSETAMALSVTDGLDVFDALALLLKPEGIMVKNELYIEEMSDVFDYTIQIKYDSPKICSQIMAMGSNRVDFFHERPKDHNIHNFLIQRVEEMDDLFEYMHDYRKNDARAQGRCDSLPITTPNTDVQGKSAGILHVLDIENSKGVKLEDALATAIQETGLTSIASPTAESKDDALAVVVLNEGYVVARSWPDQGYVAVGVNLWGSFHKYDSIRESLLKAFKTTSLSEFRVVVGGMYGSTTWKEDQPRIGPQIVQNRNCDQDATLEVTDDSLTGELVSEVAIEEVLRNLLPNDHDDKLVVGVVCGFKGEDDCIIKDVLEKISRVDKVLTFWACPEVKELQDENDEENENGEDVMSQAELAKMFACEKAMITQLHEEMEADDLYLDVFAVDSSSPYEMAQIFNSIWNIPKYQRWYIEQQRNLFMGVSFNPEIGFQRNFLDRYRTDVRFDPAARVELILNFGESSMELGVVSVGDESVFQSLSETERKIKERLEGHKDVEVVLRKIHGAQWNFREHLEPREFSQDDYDAEPGKIQFSQQKPLGRETIYQLIRNPGKEGSTVPTLKELGSNLEKCLSKHGFTNTKAATFDSVGDGGVLVAISKEGNALVTWDGRDHVDINLFSFNDTEEIADSFINSFTESMDENLVVALRDDYPRGTGRVVNFQSDLL